VKDITTGAGIQAKSLYRVEEGDFVYNRLFAWKGSFAVATKENHGCYVSNEFPCFAVNRSRLDGRFLWRFFSRTSVWDEALSESTGGTPTSRNRLKEHKFLAFKIPLLPLDEQRRIVARVEQLAAKIGEARGLREKSDYESNAFFLKRVKEIFGKSDGGALPTGATFKVTTGGTPSRGNSAFWGGDVKWVSSGEVNFRVIVDTNEKITDVGVANSNAKIYPPGTVLVAMIGQGKTRGQCAILGCHAATNQNVAGIHVYETAHLPEYVYWWFYSQYVENRAAETGTAQPALSGERVKQIPIPLPAPEEQRRVVAYLDDLKAKVGALKKLQAETAAELDALLPSILDKAFKGEL
jgi:type I restriction enzyme S subunit